MKLKAYFAAAYRGALGDNATDADIAANVEKAIEVGCKIRADFPQLAVFIPHEECICNELWKTGVVDSDDILEACCLIVQSMDIIIAYGVVSSGMATEIDQATALDIPVIYIDSYDEQAKYKIAQEIMRQMPEPSQDTNE